MHGDAFRDPASERVQINVLLNMTSVLRTFRPPALVRTKVPLLVSLALLTELDPGKS